MICAAVIFAVLSLPATAETIPYVKNGTPDQTMDAFWPASRPSAAVMFVHGGSLKESGERRSSPVYRDVCVPFVKAGIACASIDYRLSPGFRWPAMPNDVAAAIAAFRPLIVEHGGDARRLFLFGHSSGCHLAAIVSTNPAYLESAGLQRSDLAGFIAMGCTLDREDAALRRLTADQIRTPFLRDPDEVATYGTPEAWLSANPASFVDSGVPPALVVLAMAERFMPPVLEQGARFVRRLIEAGVPANLVIVPGDHMGSIAAVAKSGDPTFQAILKLMENPVAAGAEH
ncbi:MAG: alpha/beta hydrolase [Thermoanaerobaculia bacterium]